MKCVQPLDYFKDALLEGLNNIAGQGIFTTDSELNICTWNYWLEIHSGRTATEMIGQNLLKAYPDMKTRRLERFYYQALNGQVVLLSQRLHGYLLRMSPSGVATKAVQMQQSVRIAPLLDNGHTIGTICFIEDVTERVEREAELLRQIQALEMKEIELLVAHSNRQYLLSRYEALIQASGQILYDWEPQNNNITYEGALEKILGYSQYEMLGGMTRWIELIHPEDRQAFNQEIERILATQEPLNLEYRVLQKNGNYITIEDKGYFFEDRLNHCYRMVGFLVDITQRKQAEDRVREQAALLDIATDAIIVRDLENKILFWNKGAERIYGWGAAEVLGETFNDLLCWDNSLQILEAKRTAIQQGEWQGELHKVTKNGRKIIVESRWTLVRDRAGQPQSILAVNTDITEKKQLEAQFLRAQRMESIGTLASGIAHDLNNLLTPILASAQLLKIELPLQKKERLLLMIETNAKRGANLLKQVLSFARGIEGKHTMMQIRHLIKEIADIAKETFPKSIELQTHLPQNLWTISGNATQLHQVLMNLCVNARDAMPVGGTLCLSAENIWLDDRQARIDIDAKVGPYILITISDTGTGIPPEILDRIFEPFFTTKELGKGTGLGLASTIGILKSHGGFVQVHSELKKGTQFKVFLPAIETSEIAEAAENEVPLGQGELILVVDDEADLREINQITLEKANYRVLVANNGLEALTLYDQYKNEISVVLLDMMMPVMDGPITIQALKKSNAEVKILAISGLATILMDESIKLSVKAFLPKPYTSHELLKILRETIA